MSDHTAYAIANRKIDPSRRPATGLATKPDGSPVDNDRAEIGPTQLAFDEWAAAGIEAPDLETMRRFRLDRIVAALAERDYGGLLMFDPLNIRYATDSTNMQLWNAHNPFRACLVCPDGYMVLWEYKGPGLAILSEFNPLVREVRKGASMFYFATGDRGSDDARAFVDQVNEVMRAHGGNNRRLAVDKIMIHGLHALETADFIVEDGEEVTEKTRAVKGEDEIKAMRCAMHGCEMSMTAMERAMAPGMTEDELWAVLHAENIRRGGEWIETRLLASGPRTNPWFQECGPRVIQPNEIVAFDTDLIGCYGMCADISRTWWLGDQEPTAEMKRLYRFAHEHIMTNIELCKPGVSFKELTFGGHQMTEEFMDQRYGVRMHGVGLCDEWPAIKHPIDWREGAFDYYLEPGMMLCVEALIGTEGGEFSIKLEDQILITETGYENLTKYPFDARLLG
ncbi:MAG: dimethylsulfonioproprionate lyase DddP [Paracoccaceae bacterium]